MSHAAMSRLNSRHHFTSPDPALHIDGGSQSPFARSQVVLDAPTAVNVKADPTLRAEVAKKELESKLKSRISSSSSSSRGCKQMQMSLADRAFSVASQVSRDAGDDDVDDEYGEVYGWRFDQTAEADRANEILLRFEGNSSFTPTPHSPMALSKSPRNDRSIQSISSFSSFNVPSVESESTALLERSGSFMKLHSLKSSTIPKSLRGLTRDTSEKNQSILASVDAALSSFATKKATKSLVPQKKETATMNREDLFPSEAHKIRFQTSNSAPSEEGFRVLFEVQDVNSSTLNQQDNIGKLEPIQAHNANPVGHSSGPIYSMEPKVKGFVMRPPPLNLSVTLGGSAVMNQYAGSSMGSILRSPQHLSESPSFRNGGKKSEPGNSSRSRDATIKTSRDGNASPLSTASSSFLLQALKKTSSFLAMPLPMLALAPIKQEAENISAEIQLAVTSHQRSPINAQVLHSKSKSEQPRKTGILSERHKRIIGESSPGVGTPVIYVPQSDPSTSDSNISGTIGLFEVGNPNLGRFKASQVSGQSDEFAIKNAVSLTRLDVSDVGPSKLSKDLDDTWSACWDDEAGAIYYYNKNTGEATWLPPKVDEAGDGGNEEDFFQIINSGLTKELSELNIGDSDLTLKTKRIAARHKLWSKLRNRYEGDTETQFSQTLLKEEKVHYAKLEDSEVLWEYQKELSDWVV